MTDDLPSFDLERYLPYQFSIISAELSSSLAKLYQAQFGISVAEWRILVNLAYSDSRSVRDIQKRIHMDKPKVSRALVRLQERGLLTKEIDKADRRLLVLELTREGRNLVTQLVPLAEDFQRQIAKKMDGHIAELQDHLSHLIKELSDDKTL